MFDPHFTFLNPFGSFLKAIAGVDKNPIRQNIDNVKTMHKFLILTLFIFLSLGQIAPVCTRSTVSLVSS